MAAPSYREEGKRLSLTRHSGTAPCPRRRTACTQSRSTAKKRERKTVETSFLNVPRSETGTLAFPKTVPHSWHSPLTSCLCPQAEQTTSQTSSRCSRWPSWRSWQKRQRYVLRQQGVCKRGGKNTVRCRYRRRFNILFHSPEIVTEKKEGPLAKTLIWIR